MREKKTDEYIEHLERELSGAREELARLQMKYASLTSLVEEIGTHWRELEELLEVYI